MDLKTTLLCAAGVALLIGGVALDNTMDRLDKEKSKHHVTQVAYDNFRVQTRKISENTSLHYGELLNESNRKANKELATKASALSSALATSGSLQRTIDDLRTRSRTSSCEANKEYAVVSGELLSLCQQTVVWLSEQADGHRIDAAKFDNAWPTTTKGSEE